MFSPRWNSDVVLLSADVEKHEEINNKIYQ